MKKYISLFYILFLLIFVSFSEAGLLLNSGIVEAGPDGWCKTELEIDASKVPGDLSNFPVLLTEDSVPATSLDKDGSCPAYDGGGNIQFWDTEAGSTRYPCEVVTFTTNNNPASGVAEIHVKVPSVNGTIDTKFWMWYGKSGESQPAANGTYGSEAVWDANFKMVQHMNEDPSGSAPQMIDSTSNDNDGTSNGTMLTEDLVAAQIGNGLDFEGTDDYIELPNNASLNITGNITITSWIKTSSITKHIIGGYNEGDPWNGYGFRVGDTNKLDYYSNSHGSWVNSNSDVNDNAQHSVSVSFSGTTATFYKDGSSDGTPTSVVPSSFSGTRAIGAVRDGTGAIAGIIDEVRISNIARSAAWIGAEYNNQYDAGAFVSVSGGIDSPTVTTQAVDNIHDNNATGHGTITATGGENCSKRGICWDTAPIPTTSDSKAEDSGSYGTGAFSKTISPLITDTKYYVRAYAINSAGTSYGDQVDFTTTGIPPAGCSCYVDIGGDDGTGNGTSGNPWLTVVYALSQSNFGESICINDGTYNESQMVVPAGVSLRSTSENATLVTIQPNVWMNTLTPFLKMQTASPDSEGNQTISYLGINGHTASHSCCLAISIKNRNNVRIHNNYIHDFYAGTSSSYCAHGISVRSSTSYPSDFAWPEDTGLPGNDTALDAVWPLNPVKNLEIDNNEIVNCGRAADSMAPYGGILLYSIKDSSVHDNTIDNTSNFGECMLATPAFLNNVDIYNNTLRMATLSSRSSYIIELWCFRGGCKIYGNDVDGGFSIPAGKETEVYDNKMVVPSHSRGGMAMEFNNQCFAKIYNNYISGVKSGILVGEHSQNPGRNSLIRDVVIKNNIIFNPRTFCIRVMSAGEDDRGTIDVRNIEIYNNTLGGGVDTNYAAVVLRQISNVATIDNVKVKNNIIVDSSSFPGATVGTVTNLEIWNNLFWDNPHDLWVGGGDIDTVVDNPDFNGTGDKPGPWYYLQSVSPAIDAGTNSTITDDHWGTARPIDGDGNGTAEYDIGAHEYSP